MNKIDLEKILSIKRIIAFILTCVFAYMSVTGEIKSTEFITIFSMIVAFYFGQSVAKANNNDKQ